MSTKIEGIKITPDIRRIVAITGRDRLRKKVTDGRVNHPKGKTKSRGKHLLRSRQLVSGMNYRIEGDKVLFGVTGPAKTYARILHEGGTIKPKSAKFLAIPLTPAARVKKPCFR